MGGAHRLRGIGASRLRGRLDCRRGSVLGGPAFMALCSRVPGLESRHDLRSRRPAHTAQNRSGPRPGHGQRHVQSCCVGPPRNLRCIKTVPERRSAARSHRLCRPRRKRSRPCPPETPRDRSPWDRVGGARVAAEGTCATQDGASRRCLTDGLHRGTPAAAPPIAARTGWLRSHPIRMPAGRPQGTRLSAGDAPATVRRPVRHEATMAAGPTLAGPSVAARATG